MLNSSAPGEGHFHVMILTFGLSAMLACELSLPSKLNMLSCLRIFRTDCFFPCLISHVGSCSCRPYSLSAVCGRFGEMNLEGILTSTSRFTVLVRRRGLSVRTDCNPATVGQPVWSQSVALAIGFDPI